MARSSASVPIRVATVVAIAATMLAFLVTAAARSHTDRFSAAGAEVAGRSAALQADRRFEVSLFEIERCLNEERKGDPAPPTAVRSRDAVGRVHRVTLPPASAGEEGIPCPIIGMDG